MYGEVSFPYMGMFVVSVEMCVCVCVCVWCKSHLLMYVLGAFTYMYVCTYVCTQTFGVQSSWHINGSLDTGHWMCLPFMVPWNDHIITVTLLCDSARG